MPAVSEQISAKIELSAFSVGNFGAVTEWFSGVFLWRFPRGPFQTLEIFYGILYESLGLFNSLHNAFFFLHNWRLFPDGFLGCQQFRNSFRAVSEQFRSSFGAVFRWDGIISAFRWQVQSGNRAVPEQFQGSKAFPPAIRWNAICYLMMNHYKKIKINLKKKLIPFFSGQFLSLIYEHFVFECGRWNLSGNFGISMSELDVFWPVSRQCASVKMRQLTPALPYLQIAIFATGRHYSCWVEMHTTGFRI